MVKNFQNTWFKLGLILFICFSTNIFPQFNRVQYQILGIAVEGNQSADPNTIIANTGLNVGSEIEVPGDETINAIKRLWALGIFEDVQIIVDKKIGDGAFLLIKVKEYPRIERCVIEGFDEISESDLKAKTNFVSGQTLKPQDIYRAKQEMKELYDEEGYLNAEIEHQTYTFSEADTIEDKITTKWISVDDPGQEFEVEYNYNPDRPSNIINKVKNRLLLTYTIDEGDEVSVRKITFTGNNAFNNDDLISELDETTESKWWRFWSSSNFHKKEFEEDLKLIANFYKKNGYRDFQILSDSISYSEDKTELDLYINVFEGPQFKIRNIYWYGNTLYTDEELSNRLGFNAGDIYDLEKFNMNLNFNEKQTDVSSLYQDTGYLGFQVITNEEKVGVDSIDININVTENSRFKIGNVIITGNDRTMDKVIRRELYTVPGDYFSRNFIFRSIQQLANLQYFNVEKLYQTGIDYRPENDSTVSLIYNVEEKSSDYLNASVGYSGSWGFSGAIGITLTNFSLAHPFQMGAGQVLNFNWQFGVGNFYRTFSLGFTEPWFLDTPTMIGFDVFDTRQRYVYDLRQSGGTIKLGRRLTWPDNYFYVQGYFKFQYNDVIDGAGFYNTGLTRQYTLGATISRTDIDNPIFPSRGSKFSIGGEISGGPFLPGQVDYYKLAFSSEWYKRLFNSNRFAFYLSTEFGYIHELVDGTPIQPFEFYFMGGNGMIIATTPLRGYNDRSVGPKNSSGNLIGGRVMTKYTAELRIALALEPMPIYVLAFAEAGNVFFNLQNTDFFNLRRSAGFGARIFINPVGLIGFDYGYGFDRKSVDGLEPQWVFHFQFGKGF
ncbi:outer membrane protein assembly factor BamA [Bacteroidota bacterium]